MTLVDDIERLGRAVEEETVDRAVAIRELVAAGGLTEAGAADLLDSWRAARAQFDAEVDTARAGLTGALEDLRRL